MMGVKPEEGEPIATRWLVPTAAPSVQRPTAAIPFAPEVAGVPVTLPPPSGVEKVTDAPGTGLSYWSVKRTAGAIGTGVPRVVLWLSPALRTMRVAGPASAVAVNAPSNALVETARASSRCGTAVDVPNVHVVCAIPWLFVLADAGAADPPPLVTRNASGKFFAGFPLVSVAWITSGCARVVPTIPCCPSPDTSENERLDPAGAVVSRLQVARSRAAKLSAADAGSRVRRIEPPAFGGSSLWVCIPMLGRFCGTIGWKWDRGVAQFSKLASAGATSALP